MTDARAPPVTPAPRKARTRLGREDVVMILLVANLAGLAALAARVLGGDKPVVVTVGITQLTRDYMAKLATTNISPEETRIRAQLFLAVAQDAVKGAASRKGLLVVPRECVLAGEFADMTPDVARAVEATLAARAGAGPVREVPHAAP